MLGIKVLITVVLLTGIAGASSDKECLVCHGESAEQKVEAPAVKVSMIEQSVHKGLACGDCHIVNAKKPHKGVEDVICGKGHLACRHQRSMEHPAWNGRTGSR